MYTIWVITSYFLFTVLIEIVPFAIANNSKLISTTTNPGKDDDLDIDPFKVREEGCPMIAERANLDIVRLDGEWKMPFASLNWLADIGLALFNTSVKMSQITSICPRVIITHDPTATHEMNPDADATWTLRFIQPKLKGEMDLRCWFQNRKAISKFICWNDKESRDLYLLIAATDHHNWMVLVRCSPTEPDAPPEGMSWAILSKTVPMDSDVSDVLFGLLEGYGFDVEEFKTQLFYDSCKKS